MNGTTSRRPASLRVGVEEQQPDVQRHQQGGGQRDEAVDVLDAEAGQPGQRSPSGWRCPGRSTASGTPGDDAGAAAQRPERLAGHDRGRGVTGGEKLLPPVPCRRRPGRGWCGSGTRAAGGLGRAPAGRAPAGRGLLDRGLVHRLGRGVDRGLLDQGLLRDVHRQAATTGAGASAVGAGSTTAGGTDRRGRDVHRGGVGHRGQLDGVGGTSASAGLTVSA